MTGNTEDSLRVRDGMLTITAKEEETPDLPQGRAKAWRNARPTMLYKSCSITAKGIKGLFPHDRHERP